MLLGLLAIMRRSVRNGKIRVVVNRQLIVVVVIGQLLEGSQRLVEEREGGYLFVFFVLLIGVA